MLSRKLFSGFLAVLLLISNSGFAFNVHFCEGKIASIRSAYAITELCEMTTEGKSCCSEPSKDDKPCCEDKTVDIRKSNDVIVKVFSVDTVQLFTSTLINSVNQPTLLTLDRTPLNTYFKSQQSRSLFQLYSQYIFYA